MFQINSARFSGHSGCTYDFYVYPIDQTLKQVGGVYAITRRYKNNRGWTSHDILYVGETGDLSRSLVNHPKQDCFARQNANCLCTHVDEDENSRFAKMDDLIHRHRPGCNS